MNRFRKSEQGFTLVELLIVVAIIGILAAIAIPQFAKYKRNAAIASCEASLKACISEAGALYAENSSWTKFNCTIDGIKKVDEITIDKTTGEMNDVTITDLVGASGYTLNGTFRKATNLVSCNATS